MARDPEAPLDDPEVWYPNGMLIDNRAQADDDDDEEDTIVLEAKDIQALNRFLGSGKMLPVTRDDLLRGLGIKDREGEISAALGKEIDTLVGTYGTIKTDCDDFDKNTWKGIVDVAEHNKNYAFDLSGDGEAEYAFRIALLSYIGEYHDERGKPESEQDQAKIEELEEDIIALCDEELETIDRMHTGAQKAIDGLEEFESKCADHERKVEDSETSLTGQLKDEGNDIEELEEQIKEANGRIKQINRDIDSANKQIRDAPKYMWIWPIGTGIGTWKVIEAKNKRKVLINELKEVKQLLDTAQAKLKVATCLTTNISSIVSQVTGLKEEIGPAILNLQTLQGAWHNMRTDLEGLRGAVGRPKDKIPSLNMTTMQLNLIVRRWKNLYVKAENFIHISQISPPTTDLAEYIEVIEVAIARDAMREKVMTNMKKILAKKQ